MMNFGQALELVKNGKKIYRDGWNGKGMYVYFVPAAKYKRCVEAASNIADENDMVQYNSYFAIKNVDNSVSTWVPSVNDCLAEDWRIVEE